MKFLSLLSASPSFLFSEILTLSSFCVFSTILCWCYFYGSPNEAKCLFGRILPSPYWGNIFSFFERAWICCLMQQLMFQHDRIFYWRLNRGLLGGFWIGLICSGNLQSHFSEKVWCLLRRRFLTIQNRSNFCQIPEPESIKIFVA